MRFGIWMAAWAVSVAGVFGQIALPGKDPRDKLLPAFLSQNGNAATWIQGLNANFGTNRLTTDLLEDAWRGNSGARKLDGLFTGTNRWSVRVWDTNAAAFQAYEFLLQNNAPVTSNNVSRVGVPEVLQSKTLNNWMAQTNGTAQTGVMVAQGTSAGKTVLGKGGTNRVLVLDNYALGYATTNWVDVVDGVVTEVK